MAPLRLLSGNCKCLLVNIQVSPAAATAILQCRYWCKRGEIFMRGKAADFLFFSPERDLAKILRDKTLKRQNTWFYVSHRLFPNGGAIRVVNCFLFFPPCSRHRCSTFPHNEAASAGSSQCGWRAHLQTESWSYSSNHSKDMGGRQQLEIVFPVWLWTCVVATWW